MKGQQQQVAHHAPAQHNPWLDGDAFIFYGVVVTMLIAPIVKAWCKRKFGTINPSKIYRKVRK